MAILSNYVSRQKLGLRMPIGAVVLLLLLQYFKASYGAECPARIVYRPNRVGGFTFPSVALYLALSTASTALNISDASEALLQTRIDRSQSWDWPDVYRQECCGSGHIVNWTVQVTEEYSYIARVGATCSNGDQIFTPLYGFNGTNSNCPNKTTSELWDLDYSLYQPDNEGVFTILSEAFVTYFMGIGNMTIASSKVFYAYSCPTGSRAIGVGARSACYSLLQLQVICAKTTDSQDNLGDILQEDAQCTAFKSVASNKTVLQLDFQGDGLEPGGNRRDCCPPGEGIANWTIGQSLGGGNVGLIQGKCTDGTDLTRLLYGNNGTDNSLCSQQSIKAEFDFATPTSQQFFYSTKSIEENSHMISVMGTFLVPESGSDYTNVVEEQPSLSCPSGQGAVGYSASSSCYSLTNFSILCGDLSDSAWETLNERGSIKSDPPADPEATVCTNGVSMIPDDLYTQTDGKAIGSVASQEIPVIAWSSLNPGEAIFSAAASPPESVCCPGGQAITAFNVWSSDNINVLVGKVSAVCSSVDGSNATNTSTVAFGFNGTALNGTALYCQNSTKEMKSIPLTNGSWSVRSDYVFESLMEWPIRTRESAYGNITRRKFPLSCPKGQKPIGFSSRRGCWSLSDFRVICGEVELQSASSGGSGEFSSTEAVRSGSSLTTGGKAGIAVGVVAAVAMVALVLGFVFYRRRWERKRQTGLAMAGTSAEKKDPDQHLQSIHSDASRLYSGVPTTSSSFDSGPNSKRLNTTDGVEAVPISHVLWSSDVVSMENIDLPEVTEMDPGSISMESLPVKWQIPMSSVKLLCRGDKPIVLGKGGYGMVYKAIVRRADAAIKVVSGGGKSKQARLLHEMTILEQCKSVNIVQFLGFCLVEEGLLLCMEYMSGGTLYSSLRRSNEFQWYNRGWQAMQEVAAGMICLHGHNVAHLDLKTPNILIGSEKKVKIADMGLGKLVKGIDTLASQLGTLAWMAPEVLKGTCALQSDVWSFGTILWEVCTLRKPEYGLKVDNMKVPDEGPQEILDLIKDSRAENYWDRPTMEEVFDRLVSIPHTISKVNSVHSEAS